MKITTAKPSDKLLTRENLIIESPFSFLCLKSSTLNHSSSELFNSMVPTITATYYMPSFGTIECEEVFKKLNDKEVMAGISDWSIVSKERTCATLTIVCAIKADN